MGLKRLFLVVVLAALAALTVTASAPAGDFADEPCRDAAGPDTATCATGTTGAPYSVTIKLKEGAGCGPASPPEWKLSSGSIPPGLTFSSQGLTGAVISGTPTQAGNFTFYITVHHPFVEGACAGDFSDKRHTIPIVPGLPKLTLGPESTAPATTGAPYSLQMTSTVSDAKAFSISSGALPPGLNLDASTGHISGTPTVAGTYSFTVFAKVNADSRSDTKALGIVVRDPVAITGSDPFTSARRAQGEVSVPFTASLTASGGNGAYAWSVTSGELPPGLLLVDGAIDGTPTSAGTYQFSATVTDAEGRVANYPARIVVAEKLAFSPLPLRPGKVGRYYSAKLKTVGGVKPATWRLVRGPLPRGLGFDRAFGEIYGTPKRAGRYRVTFEARDSLGVKTKKTLLIVVAATPLKKSR